MHSFSPGFLERQPLTQGLLQTIRQLGEFKGRQDLHLEQAPQVLKALHHAAEIESTESSNRIEGVTAPHERIADLVARRTKPRNRPEQEIAGYRDVLQNIHVNHAPHGTHDRARAADARGSLPLLQRQGRGVEAGGQRDHRDAARMARSRCASSRSARAKPRRRWRNCMRASWRRCRAAKIEPLLLIPAYVLDFLCIHPFLDGNGRTARLLTLLLLYQSGYEVGRFISLEQMVERTKRSYYDTLLASSQQWRQGRHSLLPWWEYFLGVMLLGCYREFEKRVGAISVKHGAKREMIVDTVRRLPAEFKRGRDQARLPRREPGHDQPHAGAIAARGEHPMSTGRAGRGLGEGKSGYVPWLN